jgi:hypothetical protein
MGMGGSFKALHDIGLCGNKGRQFALQNLDNAFIEILGHI